jgi:hypothetical protein
MLFQNLKSKKKQKTTIAIMTKNWHRVLLHSSYSHFLFGLFLSELQSCAMGCRREPRHGGPTFSPRYTQQIFLNAQLYIYIKYT